MKIQTLKMHQEFDAPAAVIWEAFNDHENFGKIMGQKIERIVDSDDPENINGLNSVRLLKIPLLPFEETIRKSVKPECIEYQISKGTPLNHHYGRIQFKNLSDGKSSVDYTIELGSTIPFLSEFVKIVLEKGIKNGMKKYAKKLKR